MQNPEQWVTEIPEPPEEINIIQAAGLLPVLATHKSKKALIQRLRIHDPVVRVWALQRLLEDEGLVSEEVLIMALHVARRSAWLQNLLIPVLIRLFRFDLIAKVQELAQAHESKTKHLHTDLLQAAVNNDYPRQVQALTQCYLDSGNMEYMKQALFIARLRLNWRDAWVTNLRCMFIQLEPLPQLLLMSLRTLEREDAQDVFKMVAKLTRCVEDASMPQVLAAAQIAFWQKEYQPCLNILTRSQALSEASKRTSLFSNLAARAAEKLGDYRQAAQYYQQQNETLRVEKLKPQRFISDLEGRSKLRIGTLPKDTHEQYFIMTGFPRSGTTLLENVLASHPEVVTCEETSSLIGSFPTAYKVPMAQDMECRRLNLRAVVHRDLYYRNIDRYVHNKQAKAIIDKTPIIGANIKYMEKIFPTKKYIFSIRHPYDVVLSNWKQDYQQNSAMSAFNDIYDACVLYDYVMRNWFEVFPGETERVCYIKYDDLVTDFEPQVRRALAFLGVEWTDEVNHFAENASKRAVRTPSYANVRKGLTIGVQTSWQNFDFLFDDRCRALLDPWVTHFGYAGECESEQ